MLRPPAGAPHAVPGSPDPNGTPDGGTMLQAMQRASFSDLELYEWLDSSLNSTGDPLAEILAPPHPVGHGALSSPLLLQESSPSVPNGEAGLLTPAGAFGAAGAAAMTHPAAAAGAAAGSAGRSTSRATHQPPGQRSPGSPGRRSARRLGQQSVPANFFKKGANGKMGHGFCRFPFVPGRKLKPGVYFELKEIPGLKWCGVVPEALRSGAVRPLCDPCRNRRMKLLTPEELAGLHDARREYVVSKGPGAETAFNCIVGTQKEDQVKKPNEQDATEARTAGAPTRTTPAASYGAGATAERRAACTLMEVGEATSPLRLPRVPLAPPPLPLPLPALPALPAPLLQAATPASVAAAAPEPDAFSTPEPQAPQRREDDSAPRAPPAAYAVEKARAARDRVAEVLKLDKQRLDAAKVLINAKPTFAQALEAKVLCEQLGERCNLISTLLDAASSSLLSAVSSMSADVQLAALEEVSLLVTNSNLAGSMHATALAAVEAAASVALATGYDDEHVSGSATPWFNSTMLNIDAAGDVLDAMIEKFKQLEEAAREHMKEPPSKRHRQSGPVIAAQRKAIFRLVSIIEEKITGARRMLHLKPMASSAGGPTFWRGRDDHDEDLLEAILPKADMERNATFTTMVNDSVAAHVAQYLPNTKPDEKMTVALMWTCPFELILRQLAHIDAVYGQAISVLMLSRSGDAFVVQSGAPRFSGDQVLSAMGLRPNHVTWLKQHMQWLHTKAEEFGVLFMPKLCEGFMADVVDPNMNGLQQAVAQEEACKLRAERVAELEQRAREASTADAKRDALKQLLGLQSVARPSVRVPRGLQSFAQHAQIHAGGGSFFELRLTLFIATHTRGLAFAPYEDDAQTHSCQFLFDCCQYEQGLRAVFYYRHLSPDADRHYTTTAPGRQKILQAFLAELQQCELDAVEAGKVYTLDSALVLKYAQKLCKDAWRGEASKVPPWVPAAVRA